MMNEQEKVHKFNERLERLLENQLPDEILSEDEQADLEIAGRLQQSDFSAASQGKEALRQRLQETYPSGRGPAPQRSGLRLLGGLAAVLLLLAGFSWFVRVMVANLPGGAPATTNPPVTTDLPTLTAAFNTAQESPSPAGDEETYTVQAGDTCNSIAFTYSIPATRLIASNNLPADCSGLFVGQVLRIPKETVTQTLTLPAVEDELTYTVQAGDTCFSIVVTYSLSIASLVEANDLPPDCSGLFVGQVLRIPAAQSRPAPTSAPGAPLSMDATSDQIAQHMRQSSSRWNSLWMDALITTGQKNEIHVEREQAWLAADASRWLTGQEGSSPSLVMICTDGSCILASLPTGEHQPANSSTGIPSQLARLLYPEDFTFQRGEFTPVRIEELLGREVLIVEWESSSGRREDRLWVDTVMGLVLRWQHLLPEAADSSGYVTPSEIQLTALAINPPVPASIRWTYNLDTLNFEPGPTPAEFNAASLPLQARVTMLGADDSGQEHFAFDLYADSYYLRTLDTGQVSGGWCDRSPDGRWLAWNYGLGENPLTLRLIRLEDIRDVFEPIPPEELGGGLLSPVSFSPGSDRLAFFACLQAGCGVYMYTMESGELRFTELAGVGGPPPVWKPDSSQLAVLASSEGETQELVILDASTLDVIYRGPFDPQTWQPAPDAPILSWGISVPRSADGFARCGTITP